MWTRPSIPSSTSMKAPKSVRFLTLPVMRSPSWYRSLIICQGFGSVCRRPSDSRRAALSTSRTTASTVSPTARTFEGCLTLLVHDISETWIRPSTPGSSSMKAP